MIELLETFGNDLTIVNAARVSFQKESLEMCPRDEKLIHYLLRMLKNHDEMYAKQVFYSLLNHAIRLTILNSLFKFRRKSYK